MQNDDILTPAMLWKRLPAAKDSGPKDPDGPATGDGASGKLVRCLLCAHYCAIAPDFSGKCGVRINRDGSLFTAVDGKIAAINVDPVEKKPLFHFLPGSKVFSFGTRGCNFHCKFCQNSDISQISGPLPQRLHRLGSVRRADAAQLVRSAEQSGSASIAYTYNEPTIFYELMRKTAVAAMERGLRNIMVSNGYMSGECFSEMKELIQAANFDLKSFSDDFYRKLCGARLEPVLRTLRLAAKAGWLVELTTLVIGGINDSGEELQRIAEFIAGELGPQVPWHVSRFRPAYLMSSTPPTPVEALERALEAGRKAGLQYVYIGNLPGHESENTLCPSCGAVLLERFAYDTRKHFAPDEPGRCPQCGGSIHGVWS